ncbi:putative phosphatase regulatory subunit-domain-containing protein [Fennellomyces sp. T-0311]|nr:putative phosphatase regulatory subunit-domain-containing protein [Fennellomyces sp. T-0311]
MSLAPSFSPPCFYSYNHHIHHHNHHHNHHQHSHQSFASERRRRVTLLHAQKQPVTPQQITNDKKSKKTVRFCDDKLEKVRLFFKTQKPIAIRDGDPSLSIELKFPNWPTKTTMLMRNQQSVIRMEGVQVSDQTTLIGRCRVANLAFEKHVLVRYTTDYWQSFHETEAMYREPIGSSANTWDRFTFVISLDEPVESTIYLALRYAVNEQDYWDNNDGANYQIDVIPTATPPEKGQQKKKLGHRYDFGASLSEAKKVPYDVYQFGREPMVRFSTLKQQSTEEDGLQSSYHDFVNKYCFYGNTYAPTSPSLPSSEPICG